jgi:hypothetical protein
MPRRFYCRLSRRVLFHRCRGGLLTLFERSKSAAKKRACSVLVRCPNDRDWRRWGDDRQGNILRRILILMIFHEYEVIAFICSLTLQERDLECNVSVLTIAQESDSEKSGNP